MANKGFVQLVGPFASDTNLISRASADEVVTSISIQAKQNHQFEILSNISGQSSTITIGRYGILNLEDVQIIRLVPLQEEGCKTKIDMLYETILPSNDNALSNRKEEYRPWLKIQNIIQ